MRRTLSCLLCVLLVVGEASLSVARAQSLPDARPPVIELETLDSASAASRQAFSAQVVDDRQLLDVTLYHRRAGQLPFTPTPMTALGETSFFGATLETDPADLRSIEYYVQARDAGGNRTVSGFAFDPWIRSLSRPESIATTTAPTADAEPVSAERGLESASQSRSEPRTDPVIDADAGGLRWWQVALGVVAVGALAAAAGGGSDGGSDGGGGDDGQVPFTINLAEPR